MRIARIAIWQMEISRPCKKSLVLMVPLPWIWIVSPLFDFTQSSVWGPTMVRSWSRSLEKPSSKQQHQNLATLVARYVIRFQRSRPKLLREHVNNA